MSLREAACDRRVTPAQLRVLTMLEAEPSTVSALARLFGHNPKTVRRHVAALVELGYIERDGAMLRIASGRQTPDDRAQDARKSGAGRPTPEKRALDARGPGAARPEPADPPHTPPTGDNNILILPLRSEGVRGSGGKGETAKRGTRLPTDWQPPDTLRLWARQHTPSVDFDLEIEKFRDYWRAKAGQGGVKLDWTATARNWLRNAETYNGSRPRPDQPDRRSAARRGRDNFLAGVHSLLDPEQP